MELKHIDIANILPSVRLLAPETVPEETQPVADPEPLSQAA